ncbi:hypothetical protein [Candidatus Venteria ishoeyi]|uniref:Uncharacterized protein n=1 Tax=Candidatus Venteria ishoeyi TaxID=1899563 RepID=A0A1H6FDH3_9GAMM|nr:hypothetical protein [Candidatus Venteria ishoeyi]SEH08122.1 Uncharacterised protein [Candidatus Venteria ishoeyi]
MQSYNLQTHIGKDGILHLDLPLGLKDADISVMVICQPLSKPAKKLEQMSVWEALQAFRADTDLDALDIDTAIFDDERKCEQERNIML